MSQEEHAITDLEVEINTTYYAQDIGEILCRRINTALICLQFLLGSSVIAKTEHTFLVGLSIAAISAIQAACKFSDKAAKHRECRLIYSRLVNEIGLADDRAAYDAVEEKHFAAEVNEPQVSHRTLVIAQHCAHQKLYRKPEKMKFSLTQRLTAFFAGVSLKHH